MVEVEIDFRKSAQENAEKYFEDAKWAKEKLKASEEALEETMKKIESKEEIEEKTTVEKPKKRKRGKWFESYRWMFTTEGFLVIAGRDARQNEIIFKKRLNPEDVVLHADVVGAPLTVIKFDGKSITPLASREAAEFAAAYSSAWKAGLAGIDVYWIKPDQVSKTPPAGQYLPKGAFMIRGTKNYFRKIELKISIGIKFEIDKQGKQIAKVICGNVQSVNEHAKYFVTIIPGSIPQQELAKQIKIKILQKAFPEDKELIEQIPLEDIQRMIPAGNGNIIG